MTNRPSARVPFQYFRLYFRLTLPGLSPITLPSLSHRVELIPEVYMTNRQSARVPFQYFRLYFRLTLPGLSKIKRLVSGGLLPVGRGADRHTYGYCRRSLVESRSGGRSRVRTGPGRVRA